MQKRAGIGVGVFLLVTLLFLGYSAIAAEIGDKTDPVVTLSYLGGLNPDYEKAIDQIVADKTGARLESIETRLTQLSQDMQDYKVSGGTDIDELAQNQEFIAAVAALVSQNTNNQPSNSSGDVLQKVEIEAGKSVELGMGTLLLLRLGSASCTAPSAPGLIDLTDGTTLADGGAVQPNHLYTVTVQGGRGFRTSDAVTVFIMGDYIIQ